MTEELTEIISNALIQQKEADYMTVVHLIKQHSVAWPENIDSQLWNERMDKLLNGLTIAFGFDGENE